MKRDIAIVKAALNYAAANNVVPYVPRIPPMRIAVRSHPIRRVLSMEEVGAMLAYSECDPPLHRWLLLMLATACRPEAAMMLIPAEQVLPGYDRLNLHPRGAPYTKKRNPIVPLIPEFAALLRAHDGPWVLGDISAETLKRRWRCMRSELGLGPDVVGNTLRRTVATHLLLMGANGGEVSCLLGHKAIPEPMGRYEPYSPNYLGSLHAPLRYLWHRAEQFSALWKEQFVTVRTPRGGVRIAPRDDPRRVAGRLFVSNDAVTIQIKQTIASWRDFSVSIESAPHQLPILPYMNRVD